MYSYVHYSKHGTTEGENIHILNRYTIASLACIHAKLLQLCPALFHPMTVACQAPLTMDFLGKNTGVGCHALFKGIFPTQGWNPCLLHFLQCQDSLPLRCP